MNALTCLTAVTLLLHSLLGCCWHHGHDSSAAHEGVCLDHEHASDHDEPADEREHSSEGHCQAARCVFIAPPGSDLAAFAVDSVPVALAIIAGVPSAQPAVQLMAWSIHGPPVPIAEAMPLALRI